MTIADAASPDDAADEDFYFEGPYLVFTAAYHLKRGYCCQSGCRHCPYKFATNQITTAKAEEKPQ